MRARAPVVRFGLQDLQMPVMGGHDSCKQLRARKHTTPIVALTGSVTEEDR